MPFTPSSDATFASNAGTANRGNGTWLDGASQDGFAGAAYRNAMHAAFVAYQARADIESRSSILARRDAEPGTIFWSEQTSAHEVDNVTDGTEPEA